MDPTALDLDDQARLLGGATTWRTHASADGTIPALKMSDGPNGVRGEAEDDGLVPGVVVPVGIALGATWNPALVGAIGDLLGTEAIRRGAHVLLGPTVNIQRLPIGGRVFECFAEDPELTAALAVAFVRGVQAHEVAVTVKHLVGNDTEIERGTVDVRMSETALREIYLRPFEATVTEADAWGMMSAYNRLDGEHCAENRRLLTEILRDEWGFDGFVVSDWDGAHDTVGAITAGLTVAMPGPRTIYGPPLAAAVSDGRVDPALVERAVEDLVRLAGRVRADERSADRPQRSVDDPDERALCHRAAVESITLLRNEADVLPLRDGTRIAVIGPNAAETRIMGGGSSSLRPLPSPSILAALEDRFGDLVVGHARGAAIEKLAAPLGPERVHRADGSPGWDVEYRLGTDADGDPVARSHTDRSRFLAFGTVPEAVGSGVFGVTLRGTFTPTFDGPHRFGAVVVGNGLVTVGDETVLADPDRTLPRGEWLFGYGCEEQHQTVDLRAGEPVPIVVRSTGINGFIGLTAGVTEPRPVPLLDEAVALAANADVAVVVVGTTDEWETEGVDREHLDLPGDQDALVRAVAAAAPATVVVVNAGGPVAMPWADEVDAVLWVAFAGQETGPAAAAVLAGDADPGGRLPITHPVHLDDLPATAHHAPVDGVQTYGEDLAVGYRGLDTTGTAARWPFGHGHSYGTTTWTEIEAIAADDGTVAVSVLVTNTGERPATDVVQVYLHEDVDGRPPKRLVGFAKVVTHVGEQRRVRAVVPAAALRRWDETAAAWAPILGDLRLGVAASAADERAEVTARRDSAG